MADPNVPIIPLVTACEEPPISWDDGILTRPTTTSQSSIPDQLPFTEDEHCSSLPGSSKKAFIYQAQHQKLHSHRSHHLQHHNQHHGHAARPVKRPSDGSPQQNPRQRETIRIPEEDQPSNLISYYSPPTIHDSSVPRRPSAQSITTIDIDARARNDRPLHPYAAESSTSSPREDFRPRPPTKETLTGPTTESSPLEPDDDKQEQHVEASLEANLDDALDAEELPLDPLSADHNQNDEGFFEDSVSPPLSEAPDGVIESLGGHHVDGFLRFRRSFQAVPNGAPVVRNITRIRRRRKTRRRMTAEPDQDGPSQEHAAATDTA